MLTERNKKKSTKNNTPALTQAIVPVPTKPYIFVETVPHATFGDDTGSSTVLLFLLLLLKMILSCRLLFLLVLPLELRSHLLVILITTMTRQMMVTRKKKDNDDKNNDNDDTTDDDDDIDAATATTSPIQSPSDEFASLSFTFIFEPNSSCPSLAERLDGTYDLVFHPNDLLNSGTSLLPSPSPVLCAHLQWIPDKQITAT